MTKKMVRVVALLSLAFIAFVGCNKEKTGDESAALSGDWTWEHKVTIVCPWGAGSRADGTIRALQPLLAENLGVPVEILNMDGAEGANGVIYASKKPADGYTYVLGNQSIIMQDIQKILSFDWQKDFMPVVKLVHSINVLTASQKAMQGKFTDFNSFIAYAKANPQELLCGIVSPTGIDSASLKLTLAAALGVSLADVEKFVKTVLYSSDAEINAAQKDGLVTLAVISVNEVAALTASSGIVPLVALSEKRLSSFPAIMTTGELGYNAFIGPWSALYAKTGTPEAALDSLFVAIDKAWHTSVYQDFLKKATYLDRKGFENQSGVLKLQRAEYPLFYEYLKVIGRIN